MSDNGQTGAACQWIALRAANIQQERNLPPMLDWLAAPATGLGGLFLSSFLAATLLPGGSEVLLFGFLALHPEELWPALGLATLGNTLGGLTSYACGRWLPEPEKVARLSQIRWVQHWGSPALLLAWAPLVGDALCLAAGWLRLNWLAATLFMGIGKFARYWVVAQGALL